MSGEWNVDTLYTHFTALREADMLAVTKADSANEKRLDSVNEFRNTLKDQQGTFMTRTEVYALVGAAGVIGGLVGHFIK